MKKLLLSLALVFSFFAAPLSTDAAKDGPSNYDRYSFDKSIKRVEASLKNAEKHLADAEKYYNSYTKRNSWITKRLLVKSWENSADALTDYAKQMRTVVKLQEEFKLKSDFAIWQLKQYGKADLLTLKNMNVYHSLVYVQQLSSDLIDEDIQAAIDGVNDELFMLTNRAAKGWLGVEEGAPGNIHTYIDTLLSPKADRPVDILAGYLTETTLTSIYKDYFKGTTLEGNKLLMSVPSAIGNTVSPSSLRSATYPAEIQIKLLAIQIQLHENLDDLFGEITQEFNDYSDYIEESKKPRPTPAPGKKPEQEEEECKTLKCAFTDV